MRVLWLCNIMLPRFATAYGLPYSSREGWLTGCFERLIAEPGKKTGGKLVELGVCFPVPKELENCRLELDGVTYYGFTEDLNTPEIYDPSLEDRFEEILDDFDPDFVHIFGTEFPHTLAMTKAMNDPSRILIGIQGLCCTIADAYMADLPYGVQNRSTFRDWYKKDSLKMQQKKFMRRAENEAMALKNAEHLTGRTDFDRRVTTKINPGAKYHFMNETLRSNFYNAHWDPSQMERHSIFLSQGDYPLKGFHYMLQAMPLILEKFPDATLYVAGNSIVGNVGGKMKEKRKYPLALSITAYGSYLRELIRRNDLQGHVVMLGRLTAEEMKEQYLKSNVFVCPSIIENSPNSVCEAMLLGMPVVAAKVGGIGNLISDGEEGIMFPGGNYAELAEGVKTVFYEQELSQQLGENARRRARAVHNPDTNYRRLLEIYRSIAHK